MENKNLTNLIEFFPNLMVMEVDFEDLVFSDSSEINLAYDEIERRIDETNNKWFFLVNYKNCRVLPDAWFAHAHRGKKLNVAYSLGTVRYALLERTGDEIIEKSKKEQFDTNMFDSRDDALEAIAKMRTEFLGKNSSYNQKRMRQTDSASSEVPSPTAPPAPVHVGQHFPRQVLVRRHPVMLKIENENGDFVPGCKLELDLNSGEEHTQVIEIKDIKEPQGWFYGTQDRVVLRLTQEQKEGPTRFLTALSFQDGLDEPIDISYVVYSE